MDIKVFQAQSWLNDTYTGKSWYTTIDEDGITGQGTCRALCKALQYEIGLSDIDGIIGPGTLSVCPIVGPTTANENLVKIVQCGFYCKGYECGDISGTYDATTQTAAKKFRSDAGFPNNNGNMPPIFIMALLNTDAFVLISGGKSYVREAQQYLNNTYIHNFETWGLIPCNGVPDRNMMKGIIAALQYEEANHSMSGVDGIYGDNTLAGAPTLSTGTSRSAYVKIVQMCLMCMMEVNPGLNGVYDSSLASLISDFQEFYCLSTATAGVVNRVTWASLLSSKGDTTRPALACDTSYQLTSAAAKALYQNGYRYIGRYLSGTVGSGAEERPKNLTRNELSAIFSAGLRVFAIFQEGAVTPTKFTEEKGRSDGVKAIATAISLGIPSGEIIYFAIDYDMTDDDITDYAIPYFNGIRFAFSMYSTKYRYGVYGSRNLCTRVSDATGSVSSFVSDMSTGFSGNLGYKIPDDWAFDQFHEIASYNAGGQVIALDKVGYSGRYNGFDSINDDPLIGEAERILSYFGIQAAVNFNLDTEYVIDAVSTYKKYSAGVHNNFTVSTEGFTYSPIISVKKGSFTVNYEDSLNTVLGKLDGTVQAEFTKAGGLTFLPSLAAHLGNADIKIGFSISRGHLEVEIKVSTTVSVFEGETTTLYFKVTFGYRAFKTPDNFGEEILVTSFALIFLAVCVVGYGLPAPLLQNLFTQGVGLVPI